MSFLLLAAVTTQLAFAGPSHDGQRPAPAEPEARIFAPGIISGPANEGSPTFSPDGNTPAMKQIKGSVVPSRIAKLPNCGQVLMPAALGLIRIEMANWQILVALAIVLIIVAVSVQIGRARKKQGSFRRKALRQRLRNITFHDNAKIERLIEFERDELRRKGRPEEAIEYLMARAIERWERDNASAATIY
jgi:hypothetical protein